MQKQIFIQTYGCQMNERDSEEALGMLTAQGYEIAARPEGADVILLNTCSVRERAEAKAIGRMNEFAALKRENPEAVLGYIGCMAKLQQDQLFKESPHVDLIAGPAELYDLPMLLAEVEQRRRKGEIDKRGSARVMAVERAFRPLADKPKGDFRKRDARAFVSIIEGCDKACTYCIVPKTRGSEISRPMDEIIHEISALVRDGVKEVILLGQNVNSYGKRFPDGSGYQGPLGRLRMLEDDPDSLVDFPQLLRTIDRRTNIERIRFTSSHPFDAHARLFDAMAECKSVCEYMHLPVQSGSTRMLRAMRRGYTADAYLKKIDALRERIPEITFSTDIIVGYPGETDADFKQTVALMRAVRFENAYIFKYSPRPGTDAAAQEDTVPQAVKEERNRVLLELLDELSLAQHKQLEGRTVEILVEAPAKKKAQWFGRTRGNHGVVFQSDKDLCGRLVTVTVERSEAHTLFARLEA